MLFWAVLKKRWPYFNKLNIYIYAIHASILKFAYSFTPPYANFWKIKMKNTLLSNSCLKKTIQTRNSWIIILVEEKTLILIKKRLLFLSKKDSCFDKKKTLKKKTLPAGRVFWKIRVQLEQMKTHAIFFRGLSKMTLAFSLGLALRMLEVTCHWVRPNRKCWTRWSIKPCWAHSWMTGWNCHGKQGLWLRFLVTSH